MDIVHVDRAVVHLGGRLHIHAVCIATSGQDIIPMRMHKNIASRSSTAAAVSKPTRLCPVRCPFSWYRDADGSCMSKSPDSDKVWQTSWWRDTALGLRIITRQNRREIGQPMVRACREPDLIYRLRRLDASPLLGIIWNQWMGQYAEPAQRWVSPRFRPPSFLSSIEREWPSMAGEDGASRCMPG
jgi:hypothetical protein